MESNLGCSSTALIVFVLTLLSKEVVSQHGQCTSNGECAPWMNCINNTCACSKELMLSGRVKCDALGVSVLACNCMTFSEGQYMVGPCVENCFEVGTHEYNHEYHPIFKSTSNVTEIMCGRHNRAGRLCGQCLPGYSPQAYTYNLTCVKCPEGNHNLWKYFLATFIPLTCFYFVVVFFKINVTTSHLHGYVIFAQSITHPAFGRVVYSTVQEIPSFTIPANVLFILFGFWNLNLFRTFDTESICLNMSPLSVRALDYTIAVYPFFLTVISYILIELHSRNYRVVVWIWKPFRCVFTLFRRNWDTRTSIIDAYATFFQLSCYKLSCITQDLLVPTYVYTIGKPENSKLVLFFDGSIDYFGSEHLPYAILAIMIAVFTLLLPILLLFAYSFRCFHRVLNRLNFHSNILRTLMDSFQGCYKNGTEPGTRNCLWFAAFELFVKLLFFALYAFLPNAVYFPVATAMLFCAVLIVMNVQPYRPQVSHYLKIDITFYCLLGLFFAMLAAANIASRVSYQHTRTLFHLTLAVLFLPLLYMGCLSIYWLFSRRRCGRTLIDRLRAWKSSLTIRGYDSLEESLPHRLLHPDEYPCTTHSVNSNTSSTTYKQLH